MRVYIVGPIRPLPERLHLEDQLICEPLRRHREPEDVRARLLRLVILLQRLRVVRVKVPNYTIKSLFIF